ncbi:MAG: hypothetical protein JJ916_12275 [Phycisphaerales bacterium]|nr:hypothetical protein [Phycisphaerales bacterium]
MPQRREAKPSRIKGIWGDSLLNKLPAISRKRRKRDASKKRRVLMRRDLEQRLQT